MTGVGSDASLEDEMFESVSNDLRDVYLAAVTCVLMLMLEATYHLDKDLSYVLKPSQPRRGMLPPTVRNAALTDTSVNVLLNLYPGDFFIILRPTREAITEGVVRILVALSVAKVLGKCAKRILWLAVETIGQIKVRCNSIIFVNVVGILTFHNKTSKVQQLAAFTRSVVNQNTISIGQLYVKCRVAL